MKKNRGMPWCYQCFRDIIERDDNAHVCIECGGRNRLRRPKSNRVFVTVCILLFGTFVITAAAIYWASRYIP